MLTCSQCGTRFRDNPSSTPQQLICTQCGGPLMPVDDEVIDAARVPPIEHATPGDTRLPPQAYSSKPGTSSGGSGKVVAVVLIVSGLACMLVLGMLVIGGMAAFLLMKSDAAVAKATSTPQSSAFPPATYRRPPSNSTYPATESYRAAIKELSLSDLPHEIKFRHDNQSWNPTGLKLSSDHRWLAAGYLDGRVEVFDVQSGTLADEVQLTDAEGNISMLEFSPDGSRLLALAETSGARIWKVTDTGKLTDEIQLQFAPQNPSLTFADSEASRVFIVQDKTRLGCWDLESGARLWESETFARPIVAGVLPKDSKAVLLVDYQSILRLNRETGETISRRDAPVRLQHSLVAVSADGSRVIISTSNEISILDTDTVKIIDQVSVPERTWSLTCSEDGSMIFGGGNSKLFVIDTRDEGRSGIVALPDQKYYVQTIDVSPDGRHIAAAPGIAQGDIFLIDIAVDTALP